MASLQRICDGNWYHKNRFSHHGYNDHRLLLIAFYVHKNYVLRVCETVIPINPYILNYEISLFQASVCNFIVMLVQGWGLLSQFPPFRYFPIFSASLKYTLAIEYHVYIWQVLPQLRCGDTCKIWMWCKESNRCIYKIENVAYREINERSFSNPHPWPSWDPLDWRCPS